MMQLPDDNDYFGDNGFSFNNKNDITICNIPRRLVNGDKNVSIRLVSENGEFKKVNNKIYFDIDLCINLTSNINESETLKDNIKNYYDILSVLIDIDENDNIRIEFDIPQRYLDEGLEIPFNYFVYSSLYINLLSFFSDPISDSRRQREIMSMISSKNIIRILNRIKDTYGFLMTRLNNEYPPSNDKN